MCPTRTASRMRRSFPFCRICCWTPRILLAMLAAVVCYTNINAGFKTSAYPPKRVPLNEREKLSKQWDPLPPPTHYIYQILTPIFDPISSPRHQSFPRSSGAFFTSVKNLSQHPQPNPQPKPKKGLPQPMQNEDESIPNFISLLCSDDVFQKHLNICVNSDFVLHNDPISRHVKIQDDTNLVLNAIPVADAWLVNLNQNYYQHPFIEVRGKED